MQTISIPTAPLPNLTQPANAASPLLPRDVRAPGQPGFAGMIHEILQHAQGAGESAGARATPSKSVKTFSSTTSASQAGVMASTAAVAIPVGPVALPRVLQHLAIPNTKSQPLAPSPSTPAMVTPSELPPSQTALSAVATPSIESDAQAAADSNGTFVGSAAATSPISGGISRSLPPEELAATPSVTSEFKPITANGSAPAVKPLSDDAAFREDSSPREVLATKQTDASAVTQEGVTRQSSPAGTAAQTSQVPAKDDSTAFAAWPQYTDFQLNDAVVSDSAASKTEALSATTKIVAASSERTIVAATTSDTLIANKPAELPVTTAWDTTVAADSSAVAAPALQGLAQNANSQTTPLTAMSLASSSMVRALPTIFLGPSAKAPATDSHLFVAGIAPPKATPGVEKAGNTQDSASQHAFDRNSDLTTHAQVAPEKNIDANGFNQALGAAASAHASSTATPQVVDPVPAATGAAVGGHVSAGALETLATPASTREEASASTAETPAPTPQLDLSAANHFVSDAQLSQSTGHSEMRIAMQNDKLGAIEVHARAAGDEVGAAITVEKRDAHAALALELPGLQQSLSDKLLRIEQVVLVHGPLQSTAGDTNSQHFGGQTAWNGRQLAHSGNPGAPVPNFGNLDVSSFAAEACAIFDSHGRLSVHA